MKKLLVLLIGLSSVFGCQKLELSRDSAGTPVFVANFSIDGIAKNLVAGDEGYYLFTGKEVNADFDKFYGNLKEETCEASLCQPELKITFSSDNIEQLLGQVNIDFEQNITSVLPKVKVTLEAAPTGAPPFLNQWIFSDGTKLEGDHIIKEFDVNTIEKIELSTTDASGCENTQERELDFSGFGGLAPNFCEDYIFFVDPQPDSAGFSNGIFVIPFGIETGVFPDSVVWHDGSTNLYYNFQGSNVPSEICATIYPSNGCPSQEYCVSMQTSGSNPIMPQICATQFLYQEEIIFEPIDMPTDETVIIEYKDENGRLYSSKFSPQTSSIFEVISFEDYENNELGNATIKYEANIKCILGSEDGFSIEFDTNELIFAIEK